MLSSPRAERVLTVISFLLVFAAAAFFRYTGLMWGDYEYQHPDERFLVWVVADIATVQDPGDYFDTARSSLNPANRGHPFFVYGDLPVIATRYLAEAAFDTVGWQEILQVGRGLSALFDLMTVLLVWSLASRLFGWKIGLLAGLFDAAAVMQIQEAHYFISDSFATFFNMLAVYLAVRLVMEEHEKTVPGWVVAFGVAVGLAMACKLNTFVVAGLLPLALAVRWLHGIRARAASAAPSGDNAEAPSSLSIATSTALTFFLLAVLSGLVAFITFRIAQPYAFEGPSFFNMTPDAAWIQSIREQRAQATGDVDFPPALQWARRPKWFSFQNLTVWGLGLPLGILAWAGVLWFGWIVVQRVRAARWQGLLDPVWAGGLLIWLWTVGYFLWQSTAWNATMRYQLPIYPTLAILAAWVAKRDMYERFPTVARERELPRILRVGLPLISVLVLALTLSWAFAFTRIYNRPETRVAASHWILQNLPGPVNLSMTSGGEQLTQRLPLVARAVLVPQAPAYLPFQLNDTGTVSALVLSGLQVSSTADGSMLQAAVLDPANPAVPLAEGQIPLSIAPSDSLEIPMSGLEVLEPGRYTLALTLRGTQNELGPVVSLGGTISLRMFGDVTVLESTQAGFELFSFTTSDTGTLRQFALPDRGTAAVSLPSTALLLLTDPQTGEQWASNATLAGTDGYNLTVPLSLRAGVTYTAALVSEGGGTNLLSAPPRLYLLDDPHSVWLPEAAATARPDDPLWLQFVPQASGELTEITLGYAAQVDPSAVDTPVVARVHDPNSPGSVLAEARAVLESPEGDPRGSTLSLRLDQPLTLDPTRTYILTVAPETGAVSVRGAAPANETSWDMSLPFRLEGYDPYGGLYRNDLNFEMYWDDNEDKRHRFYNILDQADYIFISSNRQWATTTRLPERHPLTTEYYRALLGCPPAEDIIWCYNTAEVGSYTGELGYELVQVFTSYPNLGPIRFNTQFAEEAFTVYDHPKVFIFQKRAGYDPARVRAILGAVDLRNVIHVTPRRAADFKDMLLTDNLWQRQQQGGTWAALFPPDSPLNKSQGLALVVYYVFLALLGWLVFPLVRMGLPNLPDQGYGVSRIAGLLLFAYPAWLLGSLGVSVTRLLLLLIVIVLALVGLMLAWARHAGVRDWFRDNKGYILHVEVIALVLFALAAVVRLGNPDLWHPIYGGEKPMDFSHLNAVLKSSVFPPYDPWFAGGALNYYYYGYVLVGLPVKLLGITPSTAYNLIMPSIFSMAGLGAFSLGWNLLASRSASRSGAQVYGAPRRAPLLAALAALAFFLLLGNLGTVRMLWQGFQRVALPGGVPESHFFNQSLWAAQGAIKLVTGQVDTLPYYTGDWYWKPSRAIQPEAGNEITEFPLFTFLYGDLHAHWMAIPVTLFVIAWGLSMVLGGHAAAASGRWRWLSWAIAIFLGALAAGALRPANTWDQYTYLALAAIATVFGVITYNRAGRRRWLAALFSALVLVILSIMLYRPFDVWFGQAYNQLIPYQGPRTNTASYLVHWGIFLFVIGAWLVDELFDWMTSTPVSALSHLRSYRETIAASAILLVVGSIFLIAQGVQITWIAVPVGILAALLLLRPGQPAAKRAVLFLVGTAVALTIGVELVAVRGDINRMNTVFKFYYQAWTMLAISAGAALGWLWSRLPLWRPSLRLSWQAGLALLVIGAALYPITATRAKINDRFTPSAPRSLDGMDFMAFSRYGDGPTPETYREMDLVEDYYAIRWVQENIPGSPVIVETNTPEYRHWGTRFTIFTGLPGVVGWNWHERQQRALTPDTWVYNRIEDIHSFYRTTDRASAEEFLRKYNVGVIVVGQLERIYYPGPGLDKFAALDGDLWQKVYEDGATAIYTVKQ